MKLKDKVAVITGGDSGLGRALAQAFVKRGARVVITSRNKQRLAAVAKEIGAAYEPFDVCNEKKVMRVARAIKRKFKKIDVWVNNAGITMPRSAIEDIDARKLHDVFEVNFFGTLYCSRAAMEAMKRQQKGIIMNIVSMASFFGRPQAAGYTSSKWAVRGFTESLRLAEKGSGISIIAVYPGGIKTNLFGKNKPGNYHKFMDAGFVAEKIVKNLERANPKEELVIGERK